MNALPFSSATHEQVEEFFPSYMNGRLSSEHRRQIQTHVNKCSFCFERLQREQAIRQLALNTPQNVKAFFSDQRSRHDMENFLADLSTRAVVWRRRRQQLKRWFTTELPWTSAMCGIGFVLLLSLLSQLDLFAPSDFHNEFTNLDYFNIAARETTSREITGDDHQGFQNRDAYTTHNYRLLLADDITAVDVRKLVRGLDGHLVAGPSTQGFYTIAVSTLLHSPAEVLAILSRNPNVKEYDIDVVLHRGEN